MAGEDFAFIARAVPSCFVFLVGAWAGGVRALVLCPPGGCACMGACMCICVWGGGCLHGRERGVRTWINGPPPLPPPLPSAPQGIRNETLGSVHGLHTPRFLLDEGVLPAGAALHASLAVRYLQQYNAAAEGGAPRDEL